MEKVGSREVSHQPSVDSVEHGEGGGRRGKRNEGTMLLMLGTVQCVF